MGPCQLDSASRTFGAGHGSHSPWVEKVVPLHTAQAVRSGPLAEPTGPSPARQGLQMLRPSLITFIPLHCSQRSPMLLYVSPTQSLHPVRFAFGSWPGEHW